MGFKVTLRYPDGAETGNPPNVEVDALPPIGSEVFILQPWVVHQISLSVRGNGDAFYTVILRGL